MKRFATAALAALAAVACTDSGQDPLAPSFDLAPAGSGTVWVTSPADAGPGSLRAALATADGNPSVSRIRVDQRVRSIALQSPLVYSGSQALRIEGNNVELLAGGVGTGQGAFLADGGADLYLGNLTVRNAPGVGITVSVPGPGPGPSR